MSDSDFFRSRTWVEYGSFSLPNEKLEREKKRQRRAWLILPVYFVCFFSFVCWRFKGDQYPPLYYYPYLGFRWFWTLILSRGLWDRWSLKLLEWFAVSFLGCAGVYALLSRRTQKHSLIERVQGSSRFASRDELVNAGLLPFKPKLSLWKKTKRLFHMKSVPVPPDDGVIVGGWKNPENGTLEYLVHKGPEHVLAVAPTGSGKGINLVIPTLLTWRESCFVTDIKGENFLLTAGYRKNKLGQHVYKWEPTDKTHKFARFNPLQEITLTEDVILQGKTRTDGTPQSSETAEIQQIALTLADPDGRGLNEGQDSHWKMAAFNLLVGIITHVLYKGRREHKVASIGDVRKMLQQGDCKTIAALMLSYKHIRNPIYARTPDEELKKIEKTQEEKRKKALAGAGEDDPENSGNDAYDPHKDAWICHPVVESAARELGSKDEREGASVVSTALAGLGLWDDDNVEWNTSESSFTISELVNQNEPATLYLVIPPVDLIRLVPLIRLFMSLLCSRLTQTMKIDEEKLKIQSPNKHRLLIMADEFAAYKKLEQIEKGMAYFRGYGILLYIIIQSYNQMFQNYGKDEMISGNCHIHAAFAPNDLETAKNLSARCGKTTAIIGSSSISGKRLSIFHVQDSISYRETSVDLLSANDIMALPKAKLDNNRMVVEAGDMLAFAAGCPPIYGKQMPYFMDDEMNARIEPPPNGACDIHKVDMSEWEPAQDEELYQLVLGGMDFDTLSGLFAGKSVSVGGAERNPEYAPVSPTERERGEEDSRGDEEDHGDDCNAMLAKAQRDAQEKNMSAELEKARAARRRATRPAAPTAPSLYDIAAADEQKKEVPFDDSGHA